MSHADGATVNLYIPGASYGVKLSWRFELSSFFCDPILVEYVRKLDTQRRYFFNTLIMQIQTHRGDRMLSRDCNGCARQLVECRRRFSKVSVGEKVYCPDGTAHLVDSKQQK